MANALKDPPKKAKPADKTPAPMQGERQEQFFERANRAMAKTIPSVNERTAAILKIWRASPEASELNRKSAGQFPANEFTHFGPRCIFLEHTVPEGENRERIVYNQANLLKLVNWANHRIADSNTFAAISDGHTPSEDERAAGLPMPDVLGYAGPFYLGLLGDREPKWAIYADEWVHNSDLDRFKKLQRRSPEVWCGEPMERRTLDPIAALGAETPRLDSGMNAYCRSGDGREVMRYSAVGGPSVMPGPNNAYIPSGEGRKTLKVDYSAGDDEVDMPIPGKPDLGTAIQQALMALMPSIVQSVQQAMSPDPAVEAPPRGMDDVETDPVADPEEVAVTDAPDESTVAPQTTPDDGEGDVEMDEEERAAYGAMSDDGKRCYMAGRKFGKSKYSRSGTVDKGLSTVVATQQNQLLAQDKRIKELERANEETVRYHKRSQKLAELAGEYVFEPSEELELVQDFNDDQFARHCEKTVTKYSKRDSLDVPFFNDATIPLDRYARGGERPVQMKPQDVERYSRIAAERAAQKNASTRGERTTFEAEYQAVLKEHGVAV